MLSFTQWVAGMRWRFLQLCAVMGLWMLLAPLSRNVWVSQLATQAFLLNALLVTLSVNPGWLAMRRVVLLLWLLAVAGSVVAVLPGEIEARQIARTVELGSVLPLVFLLCVGILLDAFRRRDLTLDSVFATAAAYLLLALLFAVTYLLLLEWAPGSFNLPPERMAAPAPARLGTMLYYSIVTLATVGYGDILPVSQTARTLATLEAMAGQFYIAVVVAVFVGTYAAQRGRPRQGVRRFR